MKAEIEGGWKRGGNAEMEVEGVVGRTELEVERESGREEYVRRRKKRVPIVCFLFVIGQLE